MELASRPRYDHWLTCTTPFMVSTLINAVLDATERMPPGEVGEFYAEKLEKAAANIRASCAEWDRINKGPQ